MSTEEVKIYTTFDSFEADQVISTLAYYQVISTLAYYDIPTVKRVEGSGQYIGILMGHMTTHEINIFVPDEAVDQAIEILTKTGFLEEKPEEE